MNDQLDETMQFIKDIPLSGVIILHVYGYQADLTSNTFTKGMPPL